MSEGREHGNGQEVLRQLLGEGQVPCQADIAAYFSKLKKLHTEYEYLPAPNTLLQKHQATHTGADVIDLSSSITELPGPVVALRKASEASGKKHDEIYHKYEELSAELTNVARRGASLESIHRGLLGYRGTIPDEVSIEVMIQVLGMAMSGLTNDELDDVTKGMKLHPVIKIFVDTKKEQRDFQAGIEPKDVKVVRNSAIDLALRICEYELEGTCKSRKGKRETLREKRTRLSAALEAENAKLPDKEQLWSAAHEINKAELRPEIGKLLEHLHGIRANTLKQSNICLCTGSSRSLMETVLDSLTDKSVVEKRGFLRSRTESKKLIMFSMSWDGLKVMATHSGNDISLISGGVNAEALEEHIQIDILKGKYKNDPAKARAEVRKQISGLLVNIPENPKGRIPSDEEMGKLAAVIEKYDIPLVISDEIFSAPGHKSLLTYPGMASRCYMVSSTSKNIPGGNKLAFGYSADDELAKKVKDALDRERYLEPMHSASFTAMLQHTPLSYYEDNQQEYAHKRTVVSRAMGDVNRAMGVADQNGLGWLEEPNYGCLGIISLPRQLTDSCGIKNSCQLAEYIYKMGGVETVPIGDVHTDKSTPLGVRINFSGDDAETTAAIERIGIAMKHMQQKKAYTQIEGEKYRGQTRNEPFNGILDVVAHMFGAMAENVQIVQVGRFP